MRTAIIGIVAIAFASVATQAFAADRKKCEGAYRNMEKLTARPYDAGTFKHLVASCVDSGSDAKSDCMIAAKDLTQMKVCTSK